MNARSIFASFVVLTLCAAAAAQPTKMPEPKLSATLYAAYDAIEPGSTTQVAVEVNLEKPWHMYHAIILDTGLPTKLQFTGPVGAQIRALHFPRPTQGELAGIRYLELDGKFVILAELELLKEYPVGQPLALTVKVSGLACIEACVPVETTASIKIPVSATRGGAINGELFEKANKALPPKLADAPYLKGSSAKFEKSMLSPGDKTEIVFELKVQPGHHIQDRDPGVDSLIATEIFIESRNGLEVAEGKYQKWPEPKVKDVAGVGKVREQSGTVTIRVPVQLTDEKLAHGETWIRVLVKYQCCKDDGVCYAPEVAEVMLPFSAQTRVGQTTEHALYIGDPRLTGSAAAAVAQSGAAPGGASASDSTLYGALLAALLGGLILNVMPCVLPVISLKIVSFVQQAQEDPRRVFRLGVAFTFGVLSWFWLLAIITSLKDFAPAESLRNPLQNPIVTLSLAVVIFVMALNMFGVFEIVLPGVATGKLDQAASKEGYGGAFFKGFLATLLGTACTAPFLVTGLAYALTQPLHVSFLVFTAAGVGMASPYLLLSANPKWLKFVPKPGKWMETFKQAMGFALVATAVWLLWVLRKHVGADGLITILVFMTFVSLACWMLGRIRYDWKARSAFTMWAAAGSVAVVGFYWTLRDGIPKAESSSHRAAFASENGPSAPELDAIAATVNQADWKRIPWQEYSPGLAEALAARGYTVYVDYTADWCVNCKVNTNTVLETDKIRELMRELRVIPIEADYTMQDDVMRQDLIRFGHPSVPMNLIYPAGKPSEVIKMDVLLSQSAVESALRRAGSSRGDATAAVPSRAATATP